MTVAGGGPRAEEDGLADIGRDLANDAVRLVRAEIELARAELAETARGARNAAALGAAVGLLSLLMLIFALGALAEGLGPRLLGAAWAGWAVLALVFLLLALLLGWLAYRTVRRSIAGTREAVGSIREDVAWVRLLTRRSARGS